MTRAYLSGPIIHTDLRKEEFYQEVVKHLKSRGIEVFAPQFINSDDPNEIYRRDVDKVCTTDFLIGEVSNPSLGVGMELMLAIKVNKPILLFRSKDANSLSRMVLGAPGKALFEYASIDDVVHILQNLNLDSLVVHPCPHCASKVTTIGDGNLICVQCSTQIDV